MPLTHNLTATHALMITALENLLLQGHVKRVIRHIDKPGQLRKITIGDLPAIDLNVKAASSNWKTNQTQEIVYTFVFTIIVAEHAHPQAEKIWQHLHAALWQLFTPTAGGARVLESSPTSITEDTLEDGPTVSVWQFEQPVACAHWNPRTYS
jgi:hypothetical protein